jgi:hypothetical protein
MTTVIKTTAGARTQPITDREYLILTLIRSSDYHDGRDPINNPVWSVCTSVADNAVLGSLIKKGLAGSQGTGKDNVCWITKAGMELLTEVEAAAKKCEGHPAGPFDPNGQTVYCDGSCTHHELPAATEPVTRTRFFIRIKGESSSFCASGYSKYHNRLSLQDKGKLGAGQVYGAAQAADHIKELRASVYEGRKHYANSDFEIIKEVTTEEVVATSLG